VASICPASGKRCSDTGLAERPLQREFEPILTERLATKRVVNTKRIAHFGQDFIRDPVGRRMSSEAMRQVKLF